MITPAFEVQIWNHDGEVVKVKLIMLTAWEIALRSERDGMQVTAQSVAKIVREFLNAPSDYPLEHLCQHITDSLRDIQLQLGIKKKSNELMKWDT